MSPPDPNDPDTQPPDSGRTGTYAGQHPPAGPPPAHEPPPGRYLRLRLHREGGMGRVHLALDTELNRHVAFKEIRPELAADPALVRHFLFEAEVTGRLEHPGVVPVYGLGRFADGRPFYAMRFIDGQSLRDAIRAFHDLPPATAEWAVALRSLLARFVSVCQAVAYAHSKGVIHRDLKPHNVMLGPFGETLIVDWGLAKSVDRGQRTEDSEDTETAGPAVPQYEVAGGRIGTPAYWSPEQAAGESHRHAAATDVYGLGAVLHQILTGESPHPDGAHPDEPPSPQAAAAWVDDELDAITRRALHPDPAQRFASALDLAAEVERWLADQPVAAQRAAVAALARRVAEHPDDVTLAEQLARQQANLGLMLSGMGRDADALAALEDAADGLAKLSAANRSQPRFRAEEAHCYLSMARPLRNLGRPQEAADRERAAADIYSGLIATHPEEYRANIASIIATHAGEPEPPRLRPEPAEPRADQTVESMLVAQPAGSTTVPPQPTTASRPPAAEPELLQGYTVQRVLGEGALGRVLLARDNVLNRLVAIKDFRSDLSDTAKVRVVREMQVTARLVHPNVIRAYTYGIHAGTNRPFMVMEHVPGQTLRDELRAFHESARHRLVRTDAGFTRLLLALAAACDGLHFAHTQGVVHRDPKPSNVMVREDGSAVVIDWGLSKVIGAADVPPADAGPLPALADPALTVEGAVLGTPAYMPPEQARGNRESGHRADVYSLGAGLFELLTGSLPYDGVNAAEIVRQLLFGKPRRPTEINPEVPVELEAVCAAAMAYHPADRYPTAKELADDLRAWVAGRPVSVRGRGRLRRLWEQLTGRG